MHKLILIFLFSTMNLVASVINIAVAANVSYAIDALKLEFGKTHPEIKVVVILGSSGKLTAQISHGAPFGLFMSANMDYPESLYKKKLTLTKPVVYTHGSLCLFSVHKRDFSQGIKLLQDKSINKIAIANPKTAPYGKAAKEALAKADIYDDIKVKLIYGESISQTLSYVMHGADVGLVAKSSLFSPKMSHYKEGLNYTQIERSLYTPIEQGMVLLRYAKSEKAYRQFYEFILSKKAKEIFAKYGYYYK